MPDAWETEHGLNPNDDSDGAIVSLSADDYTNLEMYLNELAGDPVEFNGNITRDPITGKLIKSIEVLDTDYYSSWGIDTSLETGDKVFGDRDIEKSAFSEVPDKYMGTELVLTPCDSKNSDKQQAGLTAAENITVYVGFDSRITEVPSWVKDWTKETDTIKTSNGITFEMYSKDIKADETITLGANGQSSGVVNYIVLAAAEKETVRGDVNSDGAFDLADAVMMQKWLVCKGDLTDWKDGDLCEDNIINTFDLCLMKKMLKEK